MDEGAAPAARPALSVVIVSLNGYPYIAQCLHSLANQHGRVRTEVIVVEGSGDAAARSIGAEHPEALVIPISMPLSVPALRAIGIRKARGEIVATTQDYCVLDPDWCVRVVEAHRAKAHAAVGGAVEDASRRVIDWAAYLCEYGKHMLPFEARLEIDLPGPNVSYRRRLLLDVCGDLLDKGVWENQIHARMAKRGLALWLDPSIVAYYSKAFSFRDYIAQRYYFGRSFAAKRVAGGPVRTRLFHSVMAPVLPPIFLWRHLRDFRRTRRSPQVFVKALPFLIIFACVWSVGELLGCVLGDGGASLRVK